MLDIVSCIVSGEFIRALWERVCVFTVPFYQGVSQEFAVIFGRNSAFADRSVRSVCVCTA